MIIFAIDDEENSLEYLVNKINKARPEAEVFSFRQPKEALKKFAELRPDAVFMDIHMPGIDGIELAKKIKNKNPKTNIIFVTGYSEYTYDAFSMDASGYILKPVTKEMIAHALDNLRYPIEECSKETPFFRCFGNFEVFYKGEPLRFKYSKTKELIGYLIDRKGAICSNNEIITALWEDDDDHKSYFRSIQKDLIDTLDSIKCGYILSRQRGGNAIIRNKIKCDYFDYLDGLPLGINGYNGEYMTQYSWAEETLAFLSKDEM